MNEQSLNLARKWRSQTFDQIVGQELSIRILKNSLYRGHFFPVYLFSGQRGCGKTTTARVFAAALNCEKLPLFQKTPQSVVLPCLLCTSCCAMLKNKHPDFIEIDAASHTGVDNVRAIIDAASLMPLMGLKKIYLIDEAHMLSKAASNALLKILEEPPRSVVFILATTDQQKIIETVRSRCFTLLFRPLEHTSLINHLQALCKAEDIAYDAEGLDYIVQETEGSARDAINVLEQVRFANNIVNKSAVLRVLGHVDESRIIALAACLLAADRTKILATFADLQQTHCVPEFIWSTLLNVLRELLWMKHNLSTAHFSAYRTELKTLVSRYPLAHVFKIMNLLYNNEELFRKTTAQHGFLEFLFLTVCKLPTSSDEGGTMPCVQSAVGAETDEFQLDDEDDAENEQDDDVEDEYEGRTRNESTVVKLPNDSWNNFLARLEQTREPLVHSVFKQSRSNPDGNKLIIEIPQQMVFFQDAIEQVRSVWYPLIEQIYGAVHIEYRFVHIDAPMHRPAQEVVGPNTHNDELPIIKKNHTPSSYQSTHKKRADLPSLKACAYDNNDPVWKKTTLIMKYFPGELVELGVARE